MDIKEAKELADMTREQKLKETSGNVVLSDSLATFLYLLMRDYMPAGKVETLIQAVIDGSEKVTFHNGFLAQYASNLADELRDGRFKALVEALDASFTDHTRVSKPAKVPAEGIEVPAKLELTTEATTVIEKAYDRLTEEARKRAELELETGETTNVKELTEEMESVFSAAEEQAQAEENAVAKKILEVAQKSKEEVAALITDIKAEPSIFDDELADPFSSASLRKKAEAAKPQETQLQKRQREQVDGLDQIKKFTNEIKEQSINSALLAIEKLKDLVPSETVIEVAKVLRQEVEHELAISEKVQAIVKDQQEKVKADELPKPPKSTGVFRRAPVNVDEDTVDNVILLNQPVETKDFEAHLGNPANKPSNNSFSRGEPELQLDEGQIIYVERTNNGRKSNTQE